MASAGGMREISRLIRVDGVLWFVDRNKNIFSIFNGGIYRVGLGNTSGVYLFLLLLCCRCLLRDRFSLVERSPWRLPRMCPFLVSSGSGKILLKFFEFTKGRDW